MNAETGKLIDQIVEDKELLQKKMLWEADSDAMATLSAFMYAGAGRRADIERYAECKKYFKEKVSVFSEFRGIAAAIVITKMSLQEDYETYLAGVQEVYRKLRNIHKLTISPYMVLTAINLYEGGGTEKADENIDKLEQIYKRMKQDHFLLTGDEDRPFLAMMISRGVDIDSVATEVEALYEASKQLSFSKDAMHTASLIMSLSGRSTQEKVADLAATIDAVKQAGVGGFKYELMPIAATLGFIEEAPEAKAEKISEIYEELKHRKGFKWYLGGTKRTIYSMLTYALTLTDADHTLVSSVVSDSITGIIIEEIVEMVIITSAVSQSVRSASSSGH